MKLILQFSLTLCLSLPATGWAASIQDSSNGQDLYDFSSDSNTNSDHIFTLCSNTLTTNCLPAGFLITGVLINLPAFSDITTDPHATVSISYNLTSPPALPFTSAIACAAAVPATEGRAGMDMICDFGQSLDPNYNPYFRFSFVLTHTKTNTNGSSGTAGFYAIGDVVAATAPTPEPASWWVALPLLLFAARRRSAVGQSR